jgi:flagellar protein FlaI
MRLRKESIQNRGPIISSKENVVISEGFPCLNYDVAPLNLNEQEERLVEGLIQVITRRISLSELNQRVPFKLKKEFLSGFNEKVISVVELNEALQKIPEPEVFSAIKMNLLGLIKEFVPDVQHPKELVSAVLDESLGFGILAPFMKDEELEEIMVNGFNRPVFVFHRRFGMCETNVMVSEESKLFELIKRIAATSDKKISIQNPLLDARLPDGSRANATLPYTTPFGPTLTIRKFSSVPYSIIELIEFNTINLEAASFLWLMVEGLNVEPMNIIVTGGSGSGKTTTLNALASFVRYSDRIVTIEDTIELNLGQRENWIQMEAKPETREAPEVTMDMLLKNSLRMRPDRLIVGEVRGVEAQTLFTAMDTGHKGSMGTLHSNSGREVLLRLKSKPMSVPPVMIPLLDLIVTQQRINTRDKGMIRRVSTISEVGRMEDKALLGDLFVWDQEKDVLKRTDIPSRVIEVLAEKTLNTKKEILKEMKVREKILEWMLLKGIKKTPEVEKTIQSYYFEPTSLLERVSEEL